MGATRRHHGEHQQATAYKQFPFSHKLIGFVVLQKYEDSMTKTNESSTFSDTL
jgi:hypothetical protein